MAEQMTNKRAVVLFMLIIPFLTELLSGNIPMPTFANPVVFGFLLVAYSIPALLIRELYIRRQMGLYGLFVLGLAYGVFNEGVAARTILQTGEMLSFHDYSTLGFNVPWAILIVPWHAFFAIVYPIILVHTLFPEQSKQRWLSHRSMVVLGVAPVILGSLSYFSTDRFPQTPVVYLLACWLLVIFFALLSLKVPQGPVLDVATRTVPSQARFFVIGILFAVVQLLSFIWGEARLPIVAHLVLVSIPFIVLVRLLNKMTSVDGRTLGLIGVGHYSVWALLMSFIVGASGGVIVLFGAVLVWLLLALLWWVLSRQRVKESA